MKTSENSKLILAKWIYSGLALVAILGSLHSYAFRTEQALPSTILAHPNARQAFFDRAPQKPLQFDLRSEWDRVNDLYQGGVK